MTVSGTSRSLRWRLVLLLAGVTIAVWTVAALWAYRDSRREIGEMMDAQLVQSAEILLTQAGHELDEMPVDEVATGHKYERKIAFQIWDRRGRLLLHSRSAPDVPLHPRGSGFADVSLDNHPWRVFALSDAERRIDVHVGERRELRDELAADAAWHLIHPLLFALPALTLLIWLAVGRGLRPLDVTAREVAARAPDDLAPLPTQDAPREVRPLLDALNGLFARVRGTMDRERRFTADAAHELRTPLAGIKTQAQVARGAAEHEPRAHALDQVVAGADRATHLVAQLLTLARLDPGEGLPASGAVDLSILAAAVLAELAPLAAPKHIDIELDAPEPCVIEGDATMLAVLLRNLGDNALRYTPAGGSLRVAVSRAAEAICLEVVDNGPGVPAAQREQVLERFYRIAGSGESGSGLGLSIVLRIVELHGARLELLDAETGSGLRVRVVFPESTAGRLA